MDYSKLNEWLKDLRFGEMTASYFDGELNKVQIHRTGDSNILIMATFAVEDHRTWLIDLQFVNATEKTITEYTPI